MSVGDQMDSWQEVLTVRYSRFCDNLDAIGVGKKFNLPSEALDDYTGIGGGEAGTAGAQQERELIELLQNGRDAIEKEEGSGTLYVAVSNEGVLVANTGAPFDFTNDQVLEDLWKVNRSRKDNDAIGEKGVGLTSVCTVGDAYEVWTRLDPNDEDELARLRCGPANPTAAVLARTAQTEHDEASNRLDGFVDDLPTECLRNQVIGETRDAAPIDKSQIRPEDVTDLPFFHYPLPMTVPEEREEAGSPIQQAAMQLLVDASEVVDGEDIPDRFTTAVIVQFDDDSLSAFQEALGADTTGQDRSKDSKQLANDLWTRLRHRKDQNPYGDTRGEVTPESIIHFGNVDKLVIDRLDGLSLEEREWWTIDPDPHKLPAVEDGQRQLEAKEVTVDIQTPTGEEDTRTYDHFSWRTGHEPVVADELVTEEQRQSTDGDNDVVRSRPQLLVPKDAAVPHWLREGALEPVLDEEKLSGIGPTSHAYHPYLYYPITGATRKFPFCLHGNFEVTTDREKFHSQSDQYNAEVLSACVTLIGDVATVMGRQQASDDRTATAYPWNLLPPVPATSPDTSLRKIADGEDASDDVSGSLIDVFCKAIYQELSDRRCLPTVDDRTRCVSAGEALLHEERAVTAAFASVQIIREDRATGTPDVSADDGSFKPALAPLPLANLLTYLRWGTHDDLNTTDWTVRFDHLLAQSTAGDGADRTDAALTAWQECLQTQLTGDAPRFLVRATAGRALFEGTAALLRDRADDGDVSDVLSDHFDIVGEGVYLLPCELQQSSDDESTIQLIPVERHAGGSQSSGQYTRTVFWRGDDAPETPIPIPPEEVGLSVYVIDEAVSEDDPGRAVLSDAGNEWGIVQLRSHPQYVRELLGSTKRQRKQADTDGDEEGVVDALSMKALTFFADAVSREEQDELRSEEGAYLTHDNLEKHLNDGQRRSRLLNRLAVRRNTLASECLANASTPHRVADVQLGFGWQQLRQMEADEAVGWRGLDEQSGSEAVVEMEPAPSIHAVKEPSSEAWRQLADAGHDPWTVAKLLGLLGLSTLPEVEVLVLTELARADRTDWNPSMWSQVGSDDVSARQTRLELTLEVTRQHHEVGTREGDAGSYLDFIAAPEHGPNATAGHSSDSCNVTDFRGRYTDASVGTPPNGVANEFDGANIGLESWVWLSATDVDPDPFDRFGASYVMAVLATYGAALQDSILTTGWSCREGHGAKHGWTDTLPTLLNWQLRHSTVWDDVECVRTPDWWTSSGIGHAVQRGGSRSRTNKWLPTVAVDDSSIDQDVWEDLGIRPLEELSPSAAAYRLQQLQHELAVDALPWADDPDPIVRLAEDELAIDGSNDGWQTVYSRLIEPINDYLGRSEDHSLGELPFLTHLPVKMGECWASVPLQTLQARESKWYSDRQQLPWEDRTGAIDEPWILATPRSGGGKALAKALDCEIIQRTADRPKLDPERVQAHAVSDDRLDKQFRTDLAHRRPLIIAALSAEAHGRAYQQEHIDTLDAAIEHLQGIPGDVFDEYRERKGLEGFGKSSAIYPVDEGGSRETAYGLVYNREDVDPENPDPTIFTDGLRILFERSRSTDIRLALRGDEETLARDLPITEVRRAIGQESVDALLGDLNAIVDLLKRADQSNGDSVTAIDSETVGSLLDTDTSRSVRQTLGQSIQNGVGDERLSSSLAPINDVVAACQAAPTPVRQLAVQIITGGHGRASPSCPCQDLPGDILPLKTFRDWAEDHDHDFEAHWPIPGDHARRMDLLSRIWWNADDETRATELRRINGWERAVRERKSTWSWVQPPHAHRYISQLPVDSESSPVSVDTPWLLFEPAALEPYRERLLDVISTSQSSEEPPEALADGSGSTALRDVLAEYIETGHFPGTHESVSEADERTEELRRRARELVSETRVLISADESGSSSIDEFQKRGETGIGGGSGSLTVRPEFAEETVFASVCARLDEWASSTDDWRVVLNEYLERISDADRRVDWHTASRCSELTDIVTEGQLLANQVLASVKEEQTHRPDDPARLALVAADERGPGYDILDLTGHVAGTVAEDELAPTPIEVKAVTGEPPYVVRFTVNEFRQALSFTRSGIPYRIQLLRLDGSTIEELGAEAVSTGPGITFTEPRDIYEYLPALEIPNGEHSLPDATVDAIVSATIEQTVRGGYLNIRFDSET